MCYTISMRIVKLMVMAVIFVSTFSGGVFVLAETTNTEDIQALNKEIAARKEKIAELEKTIAEYNKQITVKQTEARSLKNQLGILDTSVAKLNADIDLTKEKIYQTELEIQQLTLSIDDKNHVMTKQKKIVNQMVKQIYEGDQKNFFEIMLTYDNFSDFYNELKQTEDVYVDLGKSVKMLRLAKEDLEGKKTLVESKRASLAGLKVQLEGKKNSLNQQIGAKENLLASTKSSEVRYQTLLSSLKKQYQAIESEVRTYEERVRKKLEDQDKIKTTGSVALSWPVPSHYITSYFHDPDYPYRNVFEHSAIDLRASQGTPVKAAASGYVGRSRRCTVSSCYAYVLLIHTGTISTVYGHLSQIIVEDDQFVNRGDIIGYSGGKPGTVGAGPFVTGAHLHFEVRQNGLPSNPLSYLID